MPTVTIACPHCRYAKEVALAAIPPGAVTVSCPRCREKFSWQECAMAAEAGQPQVIPFLPPPAPPGQSDKGAPALPPRREPRTLSFTFTGRGGEYFGIWIVNTLLKLVTLGIYSAWAKVRKRRYFYGNTLLDGAPFDYLADPLAILRGWLIGAGLFIAYTLGSRLHPTLGTLFGLLFFAAMPWLIVRSRIFNARNSDHRNIRFAFQPSYSQAYEIFLGLAFLAPLTLGILIPYVVYRQKRFLVENSAYGQTPFTFEARPQEYYRVFLKALGCFLAIIILVLLLALILSPSFKGALATLFEGSPGKESLQRALFTIIMVAMLAMAALYLVISVYLQTALANLTWNATSIGTSRFRSTLRTGEMTWLYLTNAVAIFLSLGLMVPWASVRLARYRFGRLALVTEEEPELFVSAAQQDVSAAGEEIGDIFGIDVAL